MRKTTRHRVVLLLCGVLFWAGFSDFVMRRLLIFLLFTSAYFLSYFYRSANAVITPDLMAEMGLNAAQLGLMTSLFFAAFAGVQLPVGVGLDRWGARWVTPALMFVTVIGSLCFALAPGFGWLALGRALMGGGMGGVLMGSLTMFSQWFPPGRFATASGLLVGFGSVGALAAATPLVWLNQLVGWRAVFGAGAVVTAVLALLILFLARNTPPGVPWSGATAVPGISSLAQVFRDGRVWRIIPMAFFLGGTLLAFQGLWAGPYLFDVLGLDDVAVGNGLLILSGGASLGYLVSGWLSDRLGLKRVLVTVVALFVLSQFALALRPSLYLVLALYGLFGFLGGFNVMVLAQTRQMFPLQMMGQAVTAVNLFGIGGAFLQQWWLGLIIKQFPPDLAGNYPPQAYTTALLFTAVCGLLAWLWYLPLLKKQ